MTAVVAFTADLMDRSRISTRHPRALLLRDGTAVVTAAATLDAGDLVFVDLVRPGALETIAALTDAVARGVAVIAYGSHVDAAALEAATVAGATEALARSVFFRRLTESAGPTSSSDEPT